MANMIRTETMIHVVEYDANNRETGREWRLEYADVRSAIVHILRETSNGACAYQPFPKSRTWHAGAVSYFIAN